MRSANVAVFAILTAFAAWSGALKPTTTEVVAAADSAQARQQSLPQGMVRVAHTTPPVEARTGVAD